MANEQHTIDRQRGALPDIRTDRNGTTFIMAPPGAGQGELLVIRCDNNGNVWISIRPQSA